MKIIPHRLPLLVALLCFTSVPRLTSAAPNNQLPRIRGTVASIASNHTCFDLTDRSGNRTTIQLSKATTFQINQADAPLTDVLFVGDDVQVTLNRNRARVAASDLRPALNCTDDEWQALSPLITNVLQAQRLTNAQGRSDLRTALDDLQTTIQNPHAMNSDIAFKLRTLRSLQAKAKTTLQTAQQDLIPYLTARQEATLVSLGVLD
jgi:hypothetical protein